MADAPKAPEPREIMIDRTAKDAEAAFDAAFAEAKNGERILFPLEKYRAAYPHAHGAIFKVDGESYSLNGIRTVYRGSDATARLHPDGVLLGLGANSNTWNDTWLLLNGERLLFAGKAGKFLPHTRGAAIRTPEGITLNGTTLLVNQAHPEAFGTHPDGVLVERDSGEHGKQLLLNGERVVYDGAWDNGLTNMYGRTVVIAGSLNYSRFTSIGLGKLYEGPYSEAFLHPRGVVIRLTRGKYSRFLLNGEAALYDDAQEEEPSTIKKVHDHPYGVVIELQREGASVFLLDGSVTLYEGKYDDVTMHPEGMLVRNDSKIFLCVHKSFDPDKMIV